MSTQSSSADVSIPSATLFGQPVGLYTLFFAEMWERFSYYGMRALLIFYMIKGFLSYDDSQAYAVYGAYTALVYMTPFFGGLLADRLLGARRAVVAGGLLMAAGQGLLALPSVIEYVLRFLLPLNAGNAVSFAPDNPTFHALCSLAFYAGLALLIVGNGFFKPNISTIVGSLYPAHSAKRDGGFTIFYMGINLGAAMSPLLCGYIGETYGWSLGFGLATAGMLVGLAVFVFSVRITQILIGLGVLLAAGGLLYFHPSNPFSIAANAFEAVALLVAGVVAVVALQRGGLPRLAGAPPDAQLLRRRILGPFNAEWSVYLITLLSVGLFALLVSGFSLFTTDHRPLALIPAAFIEALQNSDNPLVKALAEVVVEVSRPAGLVLFLSGLAAFGYLGVETVRLPTVARQRMYVVLILTFFSMLFWAFFEQAGSSVNNFTDRNIDRVLESRQVTASEVGQTIRLQPTQEQLGYEYQGKPFTLTTLDKLRDEHKAEPNFQIDWKVAASAVGMGVAERVREIPASTFQSVNPIFILVLGLVFTALWSVLATRGWEPSTPVKFAMGLLQLALGFAAFWYGARLADSRGMVSMAWLVLGYLLHTMGELCLSPVGLSMVTRLSPTRLVSTVMGAWFLATAFSQFLAAIIAQFTSVKHGDGSALAAIPIPKETVHVYGDVFGQIAIGALLSALICFALAPVLKRWMHTEGE